MLNEWLWWYEYHTYELWIIKWIWEWLFSDEHDSRSSLNKALKNSGLYRIWTYNLCNTGAVLSNCNTCNHCQDFHFVFCNIGSSKEEVPYLIGNSLKLHSVEKRMWKMICQSLKVNLIPVLTWKSLHGQSAAVFVPIWEVSCHQLLH